MAPPTAVRRNLVLFAASLAFLAGQAFGRFGLTLILPDMRAALGLSVGQAGLIAGGAFTAYLAAAGPAGAIAARRGPRLIVSASLALAALALALTALGSSFETVLAAQLLNGAAGAGIITPVLGLGPGWFEQRYWARATGAIVAGGGIGLALSGWLVPLALVAGGADGWRWAWLSLAALLLLVAFLAALWLRNPPRPAHAPAASPDPRPVYRSRAVWRLGLAFGLYGVAYAIYGTFFGSRLIEQGGLERAVAGQLWSLVGLTAIVSGPLGGVLADRFGRRGPLAALFLAEGLGLAALALGDGLAWYAASALLYGLSVWGFPAVISAAAADAVGPALTPAAMGLAVVCFGLGQALGPPGAAMVGELSGRLDLALLVGSAADLVGVLVALRLR
jgi:MFS family permease